MERIGTRYIHPTGSNMYEICKQYRENSELIAIPILSVFMILVYSLFAYTNRGASLPEILYLLPLVISSSTIFLAPMILVIISYFRKPRINDLVKCVAKSDFDYMEVNRDFMQGERAFLSSGDQFPNGVFCLGEKYYVIYSNSLAHVGLLDDVTDITSETVLVRSKYGCHYKNFIVIYEEEKTFKMCAADTESKDTIVYGIKDVLNKKKEPEETLDGLL